MTSQHQNMFRLIIKSSYKNKDIILYRICLMMIMIKFQRSKVNFWKSNLTGALRYTTAYTLILVHHNQ